MAIISWNKKLAGIVIFFLSTAKVLHVAMNTLHNSKESIDCSLSGGCAPNDYKTNEKAKEISDRFCASCTLPSGITCQERLFFFVNKYNYTKETATTKLLSDHEACAFTTSAMEFKTNDL